MTDVGLIGHHNKHSNTIKNLAHYISKKTESFLNCYTHSIHSLMVLRGMATVYYVLSTGIQY